MPVPKGYKEKPAGFPMSRCAQKSIRVKKVNSTTRVLVCCPKGHYKNGRCKVGTRATRIQKKK
jgi:hypothetical protein